MKTPAQIRYSTQVTAFCIVALFVMGLAHCATAQTVTRKRGTDGDLKWNNHKFFEAQPKLKFTNWKTYPDSWDGKQFVIWSMFALSGTADGMLQAYHANPLCFQQSWRGVKEISFFGKRQDLLGYNNNDPAQGRKTEILGNVGRDFWHTWSWGFQVSLGVGSFAHGARHQPIKYRVANFALGMAVHSLFANFAYHSLR